MSTLRRQMYAHLVAATDNAITIIDNAIADGGDARKTLTRVRILLQQALDDAEEMYLSADEAEFEEMLFQEGQ